MNKMERPSLVISTAEVDAASARPAPRASAASPATVLAIVCVGICLANLDLFIVNVALPNIGRDFRDAPLEDMSWVLNGYAIAYAALLVFFGRVAERYRRNISGLRGRRQCRDADGVSPGTGRWRRGDDADFAGSAAGGVSAGAPRRRGADMDRDRRPGRGARTGHRRRPGPRALALDFSRQRSDRSRRHAARLVEASRGSRPRSAAA